MSHIFVVSCFMSSSCFWKEYHIMQQHFYCKRYDMKWFFGWLFMCMTQLWAAVHKRRKPWQLYQPQGKFKCTQLLNLSSKKTGKKCHLPLGLGLSTKRNSLILLLLPELSHYTLTMLFEFTVTALLEYLLHSESFKNTVTVLLEYINLSQFFLPLKLTVFCLSLSAELCWFTVFVVTKTNFAFYVGIMINPVVHLSIMPKT